MPPRRRIEIDVLNPERLRALVERITALEAENAELRKDAEAYRKLGDDLADALRQPQPKEGK